MARSALADQAPALREQSGDERVEFPLKTVGESIGRIAEDQLEPPPGAPQVAERLRSDDLRAGLQAKLTEVPARQRDVGVDERRVARAPRERFYPKRPGAAEQIQDALAAKLPEDREQRFAHPVRG